ncbi:MAG: SDR family oxidoreductase [Deltaproteobacteria bacterium]|nr:SDR family oxidoreductase [Deltaproteobacteria bacterium]
MPRTVLVTGANRGIGLELVRMLVSRGDKVIAACRSVSGELSGLGVTVEEGVDVTSEDSVAHLVRRLEGQPIDLLINNAGILSRENLSAMDFGAIRLQFEVNAMGPLRVSHALLPQMGPGSKIGIVSSRMGSIEDNTSGGQYGYRMSKVAVNMAGVSLAHDLKERGIAVALLHPGFVKTEMTGGRGLVSAQAAAAGLMDRLDGLNMANSGTFWHAKGDVLPW